MDDSKVILKTFDVPDEMRSRLYLTEFGVRYEPEDQANTELLAHNIRTFYNQCDRPIETFIDVGASIGIVSMFLIALGAQQGWACEPNPLLYSYLVRNVFGVARTRLPTSRVIPLQLAVWINSGAIVELKQGIRPEYGSLVYLPEVALKTFSAMTISLDDLVNLVDGPIDFLKMDVEGGEYRILPAAKPETFARIRYLYLDDHGIWTHPPGEFDTSTMSEINLVDDFLPAHGFVPLMNPQPGSWIFKNTQA